VVVYISEIKLVRMLLVEVSNFILVVIVLVLVMMILGYMVIHMELVLKGTIVLLGQQLLM